MRPSQVLYISPQDMCVPNGMNQLQHQILSSLCSVYGESIDMLSLGASPSTARRWLRQAGLQVHVLEGVYPSLARWNTTAWYGGGVVLCNKLRCIDRFYFPIRTPLPRSWLTSYKLIVCFYPWGHHLLGLDRAGKKVVMHLADVMANRHQRIGTRRWISLAERDERDIFLSGNRCVAVSFSDAEEFEKLYGVRPSIIGYVPPEFADLLEIASGERPARVGFMGAPSYGNEEVMRTLAHPAFLAKLANARIELVVAGGICNTIENSVLRALKDGGARVLGRVHSVLDYYREISVTVNPVGPSTGVKVKSIETLVAGRALVTTRFGADASLTEEFPNQVVYTDWPIQPEELGDVVVAVVRNALSGNASAAMAYVQKWTQVLKDLHTI